MTDVADEEIKVDRLLMRLGAVDRLSAEETAALRAIARDRRHYPADKTIIRAGEDTQFSTLLLSGLVCRYKDLRDGGRQISALHVDGDFVDLHSFTLKRLDHNVMTLSACEVSLVAHRDLKDITEAHPHLTRMLWFLTNVDAARHREWELSLGRRDAAARVAHLLCEMHARFEIIGLAQEGGYPLELTQTELAECVGLTPVHVNRVLRQLREDGLVSFQHKRVQIRDWPRLTALAGFRPAYLYLEPQQI